jgi:uncharacterized protein (TIGR02265 family)
MRALQQFVQMYGSFYNFNFLRLEKVGPRHAKVLHDYDDKDRSNIPYSSQMQGMLETLIQMTGGKNVSVIIATKQWEGAPDPTFEITWQ